jgi:predicted ATPase
MQERRKAMTDNTFRKLKIENWKQFEQIELDFHPRLTVLTGANGSGKTTILNLLAYHFGWAFQELSTPAKDEQSGLIRFFNRFFKRQFLGRDNRIGELEYSDGSKTPLRLPEGDSPQYNIMIESPHPMKGLNIPAQRSVFKYEPVPQLPMGKRKKEEVSNLVSGTSRALIFGGMGRQAYFHIKETLLAWNIFGYGNREMPADKELIDWYMEFQEILRRVLPKSLGFEEFSVRRGEIVLVTDSGDFMLDAVSGGVSAIIDLAWQVFTTYGEQERITVLIDEVENHLHASMQRSLLPDFLTAFPNVQFIVSTHSPLVVGSVQDSNVYAFRYSNERKVFSEKLDLVNKASGANEILREVLGVPFTMPIWVEQRLVEISDKYSKEGLTQDSISRMRHELEGIGLGGIVPLAISHVAGQRK